ncbi:MAG: DUF4065 domain-containing protein [bacterium]|nr:DUF4065 domain-containing protein [bacterium]
MSQMNTVSNIKPSDVAKYYLYRASEDGELITPLKMQKLVYYAYSWVLVKNNAKLFEESLQAWPNGPVAPSLYKELKKYGSGPIETDFINVNSLEELTGGIPSDVKQTLDDVYEKYMVLPAFKLVVLTHNEKPWLNARKGLAADEKSNNVIKDEDIVAQYA